MFKKIILILILFLIPSTAYANDEYINDVEIIDLHIDEYTINLSKVWTSPYIYFQNNKKMSKINFIYSPNFDSSLVTDLNLSYERASNFFNIPNSNVTYFNKDEKNWYMNKMTEMQGFYDQHWLNSQCFSYWDFCSMNPMTQSPHYYHAMNPLKKDKVKDNFTAHHEVVHGYQNIIGVTSHPNCWFIEGQANALAFSSILDFEEQNIEKMRYKIIKNIYNLFPNFKNFNKKTMIHEFKNYQNDKNKCFNSGIGYSLGMLLVEYLYFTYDFSTVEKFSVYASQNNSFEISLKKYFGIDEDEFYDKAFDHVIESLSKAID